MKFPSKFQRIKEFNGIWTDVDAGAEFAKLRCLLVDLNLETLFAQRDGCRQSAEAGSDTQLQLVKAFAGRAATTEQLDAVRDLLDGHTTLDGLSIDTDLRWELLTSLVADNRTRTQHDSNRELVGQGIGNIAAGLIGGLPGAGATMRTIINVEAGGRSRLSGVIHGLFLAAVLLGLSALVQYVPRAVLAGLLVAVGVGIIDYRGFSHLRKVPQSDAFLMLFVLVLTVLTDLITAVAAGLILASFVFVKRVSEISRGKAYFTNTMSLGQFVLMDFLRKKTRHVS